MLAADNLETLPRLQLFEEIKGMDQQEIYLDATLDKIANLFR